MHPDHSRDHRDREREREKERVRDREKERDKDKDKDRKRDKDIDKLRERDKSSLGRGTSRPSSRKSTLDGSLDGGGVSKRTQSPSAISSSSDQKERLRRDAKVQRIRDYPPPRRDSVSHRSRSRSVDRPKDSLLARTPLSTSFPPPEPLRPPPMQPPPPQLPEMPRLPPFVSNQHSTGTAGTTSRELKELSMEEQRSAWHERIDLMFTSITSRRDYVHLESDLSQIRRLSDSPIFNNMQESDRASINARKTQLDLQMAAKRTEINETIQKLVGSSFWPVLRASQVSEMEKTLGEAKKNILEIQGLLENTRSSCEALFKTSASNLMQDSDRPSKRRRLDEETATLVQSMSGTESTTTKELEELRDKVTEIEGHLVQLENDITQRDGIISDEIELHIDSRLQEEDALYPPVAQPAETTEAEIEAVVDAKNQEFVHAVTVTGNEIDALVMEIAELITKVDVLEAKCRTLEAENQEFKNMLAQDALQHAKTQADLSRRDKEIEAIAAALQAYISQTPVSRPPNAFPSAEYIIESLESQLDGLFREKFGPKLVEIQRDVFGKVQEIHDHTIDTVTPKILLLLKMVNLIAARVGKSDTDAVNT